MHCLGLEAGVEELSVNNSSANSGSTAAATKKPEGMPVLALNVCVQRLFKLKTLSQMPSYNV